MAKTIQKELANKITDIAVKQKQSGEKLRNQRLDTVKQIEDIYNNRVLQVPDNRINIPFPVLSGHVDSLLSKIDNPPTVTFKLPNRPRLSDQIAAAWDSDKSVMRADWDRKDRLEKKLALLSGRGICNIFSSGVKGNYKAHYEVIDHRDFYCEGTKTHLEENLYAGRTGVFKTLSEVKTMAKLGVYDSEQVKKLEMAVTKSDFIQQDAMENRHDRMEALGMTPEQNAYVGQSVLEFAEHQMDFEGERYYLLFHVKTGIWVRAERLKDVFLHNRYSYTSWAVNQEKGNFWSKGAGDDILPVAEAIKMTLDEVLENNRRRNRPMRIVDPQDFQDINQLIDFIPDDVVIKNTGRAGVVDTVETPEIASSINLVEFLREMISQQTGVSGPGVADEDTKVGVFFGTLEQEADRIGTINKAYSASYAEKGYRYFWGLKKNLKTKKAIEMLGKDGFHWEEITAEDLKDVDDVDDIVTSGGQREAQINEVKARRQSDSLSQLTGNPELSANLSKRWLISKTLEVGGFDEADIKQALDLEGEGNREILQEADQAIQEILLGKQPRLNRGANVSFMQRLLDWTVDNLDYVKIDAQGNEIGIDERMKSDNDKIIAYMNAHQDVVIENLSRDLRKARFQQQQQQPTGQVELPEVSEKEEQMAAAAPFENPLGTQGGTAALSQEISSTLSP